MPEVWANHGKPISSSCHIGVQTRPSKTCLPKISKWKPASDCWRLGSLKSIHDLSEVPPPKRYPWQSTNSCWVCCFVGLQFFNVQLWTTRNPIAECFRVILNPSFGEYQNSSSRYLVPSGKRLPKTRKKTLTSLWNVTILWVNQLFLRPCSIAFLVGGLEHFLFSHILGIIIPIDFHIFQRGSNHQPVYVYQRVSCFGPRGCWAIRCTRPNSTMVVRSCRRRDAEKRRGSPVGKLTVCYRKWPQK